MIFLEDLLSIKRSHSVTLCRCNANILICSFIWFPEVSQGNEMGGMSLFFQKWEKKDCERGNKIGQPVTSIISYYDQF